MEERDNFICNHHEDLQCEISKRPTTTVLVSIVGIVAAVTVSILGYFMSNQGMTIKELKEYDLVIQTKVDQQYNAVSEKLTGLSIQLARLESKVDQWDKRK